MFIEKIQIEDYRSCLKTSFELDRHLSIIIGPNASGKTNILHALLLLKKLAVEDIYFHRRETMQSTGSCKLTAHFRIGKKKVILISKINLYTDEENDDVIVSSEQQWDLKDFTSNKKRVVFPLVLIREMEKGGINKERYFHNNFLLYARHYTRFCNDFSIPKSKEVRIIAKIAQYVYGMKYYSASQFTNPSNCPVSFEIEKERNRSMGLRLQGHSKFLFDLYDAYIASNNSRYAQFFDIIGPSGMGLINKIDFQEIPIASIEYTVRSGGKIQEREREKSLVIPKFVIGKNELSPNQLSEGTLKTITLIFYLITEASNILLIEEPEVCVHHGLLASIIDLIKTYSSNKQIVVSTHSDFVLDKVNPENVYKVTRKADEGTIVQNISDTMSKKELLALKNYLNSEGNLGEYWKHGALE